jgi:biopolymer transport protein ExbD
MTSPHTYHVWILQSNTVYRSVPVNVVIDWISQGRLIGTDRLQPPDQPQADWQPIESHPQLSVYLPRSEPQRVNDQAEALEPVVVDVPRKRRPGEEDDDPDMIPLIDISLVLLIFFMMTSIVSTAGAMLNVPEAPQGFRINSSAGSFTVQIDFANPANPADQTLRFALAIGEADPEPEDRGLTEEQFFARFDSRLKEQSEPVLVRIAANRAILGDTVIDIAKRIEQRGRGGRAIRKVVAEVTDRSSPS